MTITPSGWYPDPGHSREGPLLERWWDGTAWTEYTRTAAQPQAQPAPPGPGFPPQPPSPKGRRPAVIAAVTGGALLLAGGLAGGIALLGKDGDGGRQSAQPSTSAPERKPSPSTTPDGSDRKGTGGTSGGARTPASADRYVTDTNLGISLPLPRGWQKQNTAEVGNAYISTAPYACTESSTGTCVTAGVYTVLADGRDSEAAAEQDIIQNAKSSYTETRGHEQTRAGKVTVAGQEGYLVRWKLDVVGGTDGYVQSVAFRSPTNGVMTVVRFGFDDSDRAPDLSLMDTILKGIRAAGAPDGV